MSRRLVGVIGGVGPLATAYFVRRVVELSDATRDQDHVDLVVHQKASTPDRTAFLLGRSTDDPTAALVGSGLDLVSIGAQTLVVPCNSAERFLPAVRQATGVTVLGIVTETAARAAAACIGRAVVGVLATEGTVAVGTYEQALASLGCEVVVPEAAEQAVVTAVIYDQVKANRPADVDGLVAVLDALVERGATAVALGCTELSLLAAEIGARAAVPVVDSTDSLVAATILAAEGK